MAGLLEPVLITGASGYLASRLVPAVLAQSRDVRLLSRREPPFIEHARYFCGSPDGNPQSLKEAIRGARTIFHLAGQTSVAEARRDPYGDLRANVAGMLRLLEHAAAASSQPTIVFAGTVTQAGIPPGDTLDESVPDRPITVYDIHKLTAEKHLAAASARGAVTGVTLRLANVYGPGAQSNAPDRGVLNRLIRVAASGEPLTVFGGGRQLRDYTFVDDVIEAFLLAAGHARALAGRYFVIGSGNRRTIADIIHTVAGRASARVGRPIQVTQAEPPADQDPIDSRSYCVNAAAFMTATGWAPRTSLEAGIDRTIDWIAEGAPV